MNRLQGEVRAKVNQKLQKKRAEVEKLFNQKRLKLSAACAYEGVAWSESVGS